MLNLLYQTIFGNLQIPQETGAEIGKNKKPKNSQTMRNMG